MNTLSVSSKNWILKQYNQEDVVFFKDNFSLDEITSKLLSIRNINKDEVKGFLNPSIKDIQNQIGQSVTQFPLDYKPNLGPGSIIIFPSFLFHMVNSGVEGTTISGNVYMDYQ